MSRNPGTNPGNADRLRVLETEVRRLQLSQDNLLEMLRRYHRFNNKEPKAGCGLILIDGELAVDVENAPVVTPTSSMFVLGYDPDAEGDCKFVKFAITDCST
jgi:hypothetical protein